MTIQHDTKVPLLQDFHTHLYEPEWKYMHSKEKDKTGLEEFPTVSITNWIYQDSCLIYSFLSSIHSFIHLSNYTQISAEFRKLKPQFQEIINEITMKMGSGMTVFLTEEVKTMDEWDEVWKCP